MKSVLILIACTILSPWTISGQQLNSGAITQSSTGGAMDSMYSPAVDIPETKYVQESDPNRKTSGYMSRTGFEILPTPGSSSSATVRVYSVHGHHFTPSFSVGLGLGYSPYNDPLTLIPFFIDMTYRILQDNISPYLFLKTGYNFSIQHNEDLQINDHSGGLLLNPGAGIEFNLKSGIGFFINAGYNIDHSTYEFESWGTQTVVTDLSFNRLLFGAGIVF